MDAALDLVLGGDADLWVAPRSPNATFSNTDMCRNKRVVLEARNRPPVPGICLSSSSPSKSTVPTSGVSSPGDHAQQRRLAGT
jgi:hypothetical protein